MQLQWMRPKAGSYRANGEDCLYQIERVLFDGRIAWETRVDYGLPDYHPNLKSAKRVLQDFEDGYSK